MSAHIRALLPGIKKGWRVTERGMEYCKRWEEEDDVLSSTERCLSNSLNRIDLFRFHHGDLPG